MALPLAETEQARDVGNFRVEDGGDPLDHLVAARDDDGRDGPVVDERLVDARDERRVVGRFRGPSRLTESLLIGVVLANASDVEGEDVGEIRRIGDVALEGLHLPRGRGRGRAEIGANDLHRSEPTAAGAARPTGSATAPPPPNWSCWGARRWSFIRIPYTRPASNPARCAMWATFPPTSVPS